MKCCEYLIYERIDWLREHEGRSFLLADYMKRFEISEGTAYRDINFLRNYKCYDVVYDKKTGSYKVSNNPLVPTS